jgi:hypothetical protein
MNKTLYKAIRLGQQGIPVFFCSFSKRPTLPGGFHNAVTDEAAIRALFEKAPGTLIGVPTGGRFVVVDPDLQHRTARQWWKANKDKLPATRRHRTKSGGWHLLFRPHPDFRHGTTVAPNVDTRGLGGYVIWWPAEELEVVNPGTIAAVPDWILAAMPPPERDLPLNKVCNTNFSPTPIDAYLAQQTSPENRFGGILQTMACAKIGERQKLAFWCFNRTCEMIREGLLDHTDALGALADVALSTGLAANQVDKSCAASNARCSHEPLSKNKRCCEGERRSRRT